MPRKILVVDDNKVDRALLYEILQKDYTVIEAENGKEAFSLLLSNPYGFSAIVTDVIMPIMDGYEFVKKIRLCGFMNQIPVIIITSDVDNDSIIKALTCGANNFLPKPLSAVLLTAMIKNNIMLRETAAITNAFQKDKLTGIYNREAFMKEATKLIHRHEEGHFVIESLDVNHFKVINDQYGHQMGNEVLKHIASVFQEGLDAIGGICCRISDDRFALLYPEVYRDSDTLSDIRSQASRPEGLAVPILFYIGRYHITDLSLSVESMYDRAVFAGDAIKGNYENHIADYEDRIRIELVDEQQIVADMERALAAGEFEPWFQPQYNHSTGALIGSEALVRWHKDGELILPFKFIPVFEKNGFIYQVDKSVWRQVCSHLRGWLDRGNTPLPVSVNISRYDIMQDDFIDYICGLLVEYDLPHDLLRLEVTETAFSESSHKIIEVITKLVEIGFTVEIDDFGSGYSSLNTLKDVPAQIIKLDMRFLESSNSQRGGNIIGSIVRMAKMLGMAVIAEGIEKLEQADYLSSVGCNYIQGYLYSKPMPLEQFEEHINGNRMEPKLRLLETIDNLDNNAFWDPSSMDTLIFNSYVGTACILEVINDRIEMLRATRHYISMFGNPNLTLSDIIGLDWKHYLDAGSFDKFKKAIIESKKTNDTVYDEYEFIGLPGCPERVFIRGGVRVIAVFGDRWLVYCISENVTARHEAEENERLAKENSERLANQLNVIIDNVASAVTAIALIDGKPSLIFANDMYYEQLGASEEYYRQHYDGGIEHIIEEDRERLLSILSDFYNVGERLSFDFTIKRADGATRRMHTNITVVNYPGIDAPVQLAVTVDVTEQVEAAEKEQRILAENRRIMSDMPGGFVRLRLDTDGKYSVAFFNDGFSSLVRTDKETLDRLYGNNPFSIIHPDDIGLVMMSIRNVREKGEAYSSLYRLRTADGEYIRVTAFGRFTKDRDGNSFLNLYFNDETAHEKAARNREIMMDNMPWGAGAYSFKNGQMGLIYQNKSYWELVGLHDDKFPDPAPMSAIHPDDIPIIIQKLAIAIEHREDIICDVRLRNNKLGYRPVRIVARVLPDETEGYIIIATFIPNEQVEITNQQTLSLLLSALMEESNEYIFAKDKDFRYICCSPAVVKLAGYEYISDIIGKSDYELFPDDMAEQFRRNDLDLLESGKHLIDFDESFFSKDGMPIYCIASKRILRDMSGEVIGIYGSSRDITLEHGEREQIKFIDDNITGGFVTYSMKGDALNIVYCSDGFLKLFGGTREGYEKHQMVDPLDWVFEEDRAVCVNLLSEISKGGTPPDVDYRIHTIDGRQRWVKQRFSTTEERGGVIRFNAILFDITEQKTSDEKLRISEEESRLILHHDGDMFCKFDVASGTLSLSPETAKKFAIPEVITDVPYSPVRLGYITPECADAYIKFFEAIINGSKSETAVFSHHFIRGKHTIKVVSKSIFSSDGKPVKAIISMTKLSEGNK